MPEGIREAGGKFTGAGTDLAVSLIFETVEYMVFAPVFPTPLHVSGHDRAHLSGLGRPLQQRVAAENAMSRISPGGVSQRSYGWVCFDTVSGTRLDGDDGGFVGEPVDEADEVFDGGKAGPTVRAAGW